MGKVIDRVRERQRKARRLGTYLEIKEDLSAIKIKQELIKRDLGLQTDPKSFLYIDPLPAPQPWWKVWW